jgi:hypothetical protein
VNCATLRPESLALITNLAKPTLPDSTSAPPDAVAGSHAANETPPVFPAADADSRIAALESEKAALAAEVRQLERDRETSSADEAMSAQQQPVSVKPSEAQPASQAAADAERRIAELVSEKEALAVEVSRLQHDREALPVDVAKSVLSPLTSLPRS